MPLKYNPFNALLQEYIGKILLSLTPEQYRLLSPSERNRIYTKNKVIKFVKTTEVFAILSILSKVGLNWGIYVIDETFDLCEMNELVASKDFADNNAMIKRYLHERKSFITNSKFFNQIQNIIVNASHGLSVIWDRRFMKVSEKINTKVKDSFDNYHLLHPEVEYKKASDGNLMMLDIMRNMPKISEYCRAKGLTITEFVLLCEMYYHAEKHYSINDITTVYNEKYIISVRSLFNKGFVSVFQKKYNINTNGILIVGEVMSKFMDSIYLD